MMTENSYLILQLDNKNVDKKKKTLVFAVRITYIYIDCKRKKILNDQNYVSYREKKREY